jgi:hypothetical protein
VLADTLDTTLTIMQGFLALRAGEGNPNHVASGPKGGQFTSGSGGGGSSGKPHGKNYAKRQRRKARLLAKLKAKAHAKLAKVKEKQRGERKALREKHRSEGTSFKQQRTERHELAAKQKGERKEAVKELRAEIRKEAQELKIAKPSGAEKSAKAKEFQERRERIDKKVEEFRQEDRKEWQQKASQLLKQHSEERHGLVKQAREERAEIRAGFTKEVEGIREQRNTQLKDYIKDIRESREKYSHLYKNPKAFIRNRQQELSEIAKEDYKETKQTYRDQINEHKEAVSEEWRRLEKRQNSELRFHEQLAAKTIRETASMTRKKAIATLKEQAGGKRSIGGGDQGDDRDDSGYTGQLLVRGEDALFQLPVSRANASDRFPRSKLHKASSAESIIAHVLRRRGWTADWKAGSLTDRQRLQLLEDIRQYGRRWLRHEVESFFGRYGDGGRRDFDSDSGDLQRAWQTSGIYSAAISGLAVPCEPNLGNIAELDGFTRSIADRILSPLRRLFDRLRAFTRELIFAGAIVLKGAELDAQEADQADKLADVQDDYFRGFQRELETNPPRELSEPTAQIAPQVPGVKPPMSPAQAGARAEQYANSAWQGAQRIHRGTQRKTGGAKWERRILGHPKTEHCTDCPPLAALGWQHVGSLPGIGDSECGGLCLCHFEYSDSIEKPELAKPGGPKRQPRFESVEITADDDAQAIAKKLYDRLKQGLKVKVVMEVGKTIG